MSSQNEYDALIDQEQAKPVVAPPDKSGHNEYDALLENQQIAASITDAQNVDANPDAAAKADRLSKIMNVPAAAIEHNLPWYEKQAQLQANSKVLQSNPDLQAWVVNNPDKAPQAHDDYENLDYMSKTLYALKSGFNEGTLSTQAGELSALNELVKYRDPNLSKLETELNKPKPDFTGLPYLAQLLGSTAGSIGTSAARGAEVAIAGGIAAPVVGEVAAPLTFTAGFLGDIFLSAYGNSTRSLRQVRDKNGNPLDDTAIQIGSVANAAIQTALMKFGGNDIAQSAISAFSKDVIEEALARPTIASAVKKFGIGLAQKSAEGAAINLGMTVSNVVADEFAKAVSPGEFATVFNDPLQREKVKNELVQSIGDGMLLFPAMHLPFAAKSFYGDVARANEATNNMAMWKNLEQGAQASNLRGRNPEAFQNFLQSQLGDHPAENVYVPAETIAELYQSMNERPGADDRLFPFVKDMKTQLEQGMATGGDVVIPASDYLAHLSGTDIGNHLEQHIKLSPDAMSLKEASEFMKHEKEHFAEFQKQTESAQQENKVYRDMFNMARGAGYTIDTARQYSALYASRYETRGERLGADPYELFKSNNLKLRTVLPEGLTKEYDNLDMMLNSLRSGKADKPDKAIFGPSLLDFISKRGGIEDTGKDLKAMDLGEWHKGKPGTRKLLREKQQEAGLIPDKEESKYSPDAVTLAAWEAGYFPEHQERPTIKDLHEAIRQELAGKPRFKNRGNINAEEAWQQGINSLEEALHHVGMDVSTHSNKEIKQAFEDAAKALEDGQGYNQESRGRINFTDAGAVISLFKDRDLSTLLHESGHLWLEEFVTDAAREDAPAEIREDYNSLLKYLGVSDASEIGVEQHEKFARAFEAYLMEGKAPSAGLMPVFQKFKSWLVSIYRSLAGLNVEINPEIRGVFDRMLATDREIALAQKAQQLEQLFHTPEDAGMTDAEFSAYTKGVASARDDAQTALLKKVMGDIRRVRTAEWKEEAAKIRPEVTSEVDRRQDIGALQFLRGKDVPGLEGIKAPKLSREAIVDMYGNEQAVADMPRGVPPFVVEEGGVHPDYVAEMLGYRSGKEMIDDLLALEAQQRSIRSREGEKRSIRQYLIDEGVNDRMIERHGDMLSDGSIQQEALNVVHNEKQAQVLATELAALSRRTGRTPTPLQIVRQWAAGAIAEKNVRDGTTTSRFAAAERKAGKLAEDAMLKGDFEEAFRQKQAQMLNHSLFMESKKARDEVESGVKMLDKYASQKKATNIPQDYLEQIHGLLERFDFKQASQAEVARRTSFREWALAQYDLGNEVVAPDKLLDDSFKKHYTDMTVDEVRGLADTVKNIVHLGRLKKSLLDGKEKVDFDALVTEAVTQLKSQKQLATPDARNPGVGGKGLDKVSAKYLNFKAGLRGLDAAMLKIEQICDWMDEKNIKGVFNRIVFRRLADAGVTEMDLQQRFAQRMREISKLVAPDAKAKWLERYSLPELIDSRTGKASSMLKKELIAMALNTGNESNFGKLLEGEGWKREDVMAVLDRHLTKSDWDFVQGVWSMLDKELWPLVEAMEKRVSGIAPEKIKATSIETKHGTYEGGYYPVVYDPLRSTRAADLGNRSEALFENNYFRATTSKGHTYERVKYAAPLLLQLDVLPRHLSQVIHDLAYREAVMDADRFLSNKSVRGAVEGVMGKEIYQQFRPWLKAIANDRAYDSRGLAWWDKAAHTFRTNTTMVGLGFRFTTMLMHGATAMSHSIGEIGVKDFLAGVRAFSPGHMTETADFVFSRSGEMRNRMNEIDRDVRDGLKDLEGKTGVVSQARRFAYYGISMLDMASAMPTWVGAYTKALRTMSEEDAIYAADKAVRNAHGGGGIKDQAAIQRGTEFQKLFTMFYSFWNHMYNRQRDIARQAGGIASNLKEGNIGQAAKDFPMVLARSWFYFVVPALIHGAIKANPNQPDDEENWATTAAGEIALAGVSGIPVVRDIANAMHTGRDYSPSPVASMAQSYIKTGEDIGHATGLAEGEVSDKWLKHAIETAGYTTGLPLGQPAQSVQFLWDVQKGEQDPESIQDWLHGLMYGKVGDK